MYVHVYTCISVTVVYISDSGMSGLVLEKYIRLSSTQSWVDNDRVVTSAVVRLGIGDDSP